MNTKQLDAVGDIVGLMLAEALVPLKRQLLELAERVAALPSGPSTAELSEAIDIVSAKVQSAVELAVKALPAPEPGKSVTVDELKPVVAEAVELAVKALPAPEPGKSVTVDELKPVVAEAVELAVKALPAPEPGKSVTVDELKPVVAEAVELAVKALPAPEPGKSVTVDELKPVVAEAVELAVKALPAPEPGKSVTVDELKPVVAEAVELAVKALPAPEPGKSVTVDELKPVVAEAVELAVKALPAPKDGLGLAGAMIDRDGALQITMTDGTVKDLGPVVGKSLDSFAMDYLPETHEVRIKAACAGREQEVRFDAGGIRLAQASNGYWCEGVKAKALEAFSYDGCLWVARSATTAKPSVESPDWVLAARQGRPGPAGKDLNAPRAPETIKVGGAK